MSKPKKITIIIYDCKNKDPKSLQFLEKYAYTQLLTENAGLTRLFLFNSASPATHLSEISDDFIVYDPKRFLAAIAAAPKLAVDSPANCDFLTTMKTATDHLIEANAYIKGIDTYQIVFISELNGKIALPHNDNHLMDTCDRLNDLEAFLFVVHPNIEPDSFISSYCDIERWMAAFFDDFPGVCNTNIVKLCEFAHLLKNTCICDPKIALHLLFSYKSWPVSSRTWKVPLTIGDGVVIPCQTMLGLQMENLIKTTDVNTKSLVPALASDPTQKVDKSNVLVGISRHGKFVEMPDTASFQLQNVSSFNLIGFTDKERVPEHYMMGDVHYVLPRLEDKNGVWRFEQLVETLAKKGKVGIATRIYNKNSNPKLCVLIPKVDTSPKCFLLNRIPYKQHVVGGSFRIGANDALEEVEVPEVLEEYFDRRPIEKFLPLHPNLMHEDNTSKLVNVLGQKHSGKEWDLNGLEISPVELRDNKRVKEVDSMELDSVWPLRGDELEEVELRPDSDDDF